MLSELVAAARRRSSSLRSREEELRLAAGRAPAPLPFEAALHEPGCSVIAEIKRRSPSAGLLAADFDPLSLARRYERGGAAAISVLTETSSFGGDIDHLEEVRAVTSVPLLRKDFLVDRVQLWESRAAGADAVLLVVAALGDDELGELLETTTALGMDALVEVHDETEAERALAQGASIIGVNNRDLTTFETDLRVAERLRPILGDAVVAVAESGITSGADAARMCAAGYDAVLVGEALVRHPDPALLVSELSGRRR